MATITNNSDFLFLYEASQCNPNGDPDQENKPRMDYDTDTNIVTDTRVKRYIRDFLKMTGQQIFVDMEGESKVSADSKLKAVIGRLLDNQEELDQVFAENEDMKTKFLEVKEKSKAKTAEEMLKFMQDKKNREISFRLNLFLLAYLVKQKFVDIRLFGSAFAIEGFNKSYIGPIQLNWGYSLNKVQLMESNSIVTIMNDDNSTFGKDYRVHYSLLAFNGTINKFAAVGTGLSAEDLRLFRNSIWESIPSLPTRSKLNQYPKLYLEIIYNDGFHNGHFGDLRSYVAAPPTNGFDEKQVRRFTDLSLDLTALSKLISENKGEDKPIKEVVVRTAPGVEFSVA
ncbi:CRISPR-associated protein [Pontibacter qinzhouensis]|uniref:CRISPR-associated protein n=1 Tax=Pontibacter qinzhouensis TaxID=2603253 RepID=A0A5C8J6V9_9BACT|nr:type I CRISPR-associated protein Cas7 [Pontibacter qinzhouensis]TXK33282.1 CRISPR-associated protein [Pontibacter qinzhouensis]